MRLKWNKLSASCMGLSLTLLNISFHEACHYQMWSKHYGLSMPRVSLGHLLPFVLITNRLDLPSICFMPSMCCTMQSTTTTTIVVLSIIVITLKASNLEGKRYTWRLWSGIKLSFAKWWGAVEVSWFGIKAMWKTRSHASPTSLGNVV